MLVQLYSTLFSLTKINQMEIGYLPVYVYGTWYSHHILHTQVYSIFGSDM